MINKIIWINIIVQKQQNSTAMQVNNFLVMFFMSLVLKLMMICVQCGSIPRSMGSGSYKLQAGSVTMQQAQKDLCQSTNDSVTFTYNVNLKYFFIDYQLAFGFKKLDWQFDTNDTNDTNDTIKALEITQPLHTSNYFQLSFTSTFGSSLSEIVVNYLAIHALLENYIFLCTDQIQLFSSSGAPILPGNIFMANIIAYMSWYQYINSTKTKVIVFCSFFQYNPALTIANNSFGISFQLDVITSSSFNFLAPIPFGIDAQTKYFLSVIYFNPDTLWSNESILLIATSFSTGDQATIKSFSNTSMYTNSYLSGQGCDLTDNNTLIVIQPYFGSYKQMNFQLSLSGNSVFLAAQNYYVYNFSVVSFCSAICTTQTNPYLFSDDLQCYDVCPVGLYGNENSTFCELCDSNCSTCQGALTNCTSCNNDSFLYENACITLCPNTTYGDTTLNECLTCAGNCLNCQETSINCTSCLSNFFFVNFSCYSECPPGYYENTSITVCLTCSIDCRTCEIISTNCTSCNNDSFLYENACVVVCPNTTYGDTSVNQCLYCNGNCLTCQITSTNCTSCFSNLFFYNQSCVSKCPPGYYEDTSMKVCLACSIDFVTCQSECPLGYYQSTGNCSVCFSNCLNCSAIDVCTKCISNHYLWPNLDKCQTSCPQNFSPNPATKMCELITIQGCVSTLYQNNIPICLQCNTSLYFKYLTSNKSCVCKDGYKLSNGVCEEYCGDGIVDNMPCDDGNFINGDGCSSQCTIQNDFNCILVPNGATFTSKCCFLSDINFQILSQIKMDDQNTLKLILKLNPAPFLTSDEIKQFLNIKIENDVINISCLQIDYGNEIAQIYIPYTSDIEGKQLSLWTQFNPAKFCCPNIQISSILKGDNVALLYCSNLFLYKVLGTFNFSMAIFVCIFALLSSYKHKMIGLELIMPFQVILYSQSFYSLNSLQTSFYTSFRPVSFSIFTPKQMESKYNSRYRIGMTGGFLQNYNILGVLFLISTILLVVSIFKLQHSEKNRFRYKKAMRDWLNFGQFKIGIRKYQSIIWKPYFVSFCLSTIPLIFSISAKAMTVSAYFYTQSLFDYINDKCNYLFYILFMGGLFYTSIPKIFYNNKKNLLKKHIFKREGQKFKYDAAYCMYFELHYLSLGFIYAHCPATLPMFYTISVINGLFFFYLVFKRPYESNLDNIGALLSNFIVVYFLSLNLYIKISGTSSMISFISKMSGILIIFLLLTQCIVAIVRLIIFWAHDKEQNLKGLTSDQKIHKFQYQRFKAFNKFVNNSSAQNQELEFNNMMNQIQYQMILNQPKTINEQLIPKHYKQHKYKYKIHANENNENENANENEDTRKCIFYF